MRAVSCVRSALALSILVSACGGHSSTPVASDEPAPPPPVTAAAPVPAVTAQCTLPKGPGAGVNCPRYDEGVFVAAVDAAIDRVIRKHPEYFGGDLGSGSPSIVNPDAYLRAVAPELQAAGYCAIFDGKEIAVKNTNAFSEQYHIWYSNFTVRRGAGAYRATCSPAWF
jgi:hypothetical protein